MMNTIKMVVLWCLMKFQSRWRVVSERPTEVQFSVTDNCCLQCKMCNIWKIKNKQKPVQYTTAVKIIDVLSRWLGEFNLTFAGGEPFLNPDLLRIIRYANGKRVKTSLNSNGFVVDASLAKQIVKSGLNRIFFSVDGLEKEHDYIRGKKGSFLNVMKAIDYVIQLRSKLGIKVYINSVISKNNLNQVDDLVKLALQKKVDGINFQVLMPNFASSYSSNWYMKDDFWPTDIKLNKQKINDLMMLKSKYPNFILNDQTELRRFLLYFLNPKHVQEHDSCFVGLNTVMVDTSGEVRLCYEMESVGNLLNENPQDIWKGKKAHLSRQKIATCARPCKMLPCNNMRLLNMVKKWVKRGLH